MLRGKTLEGHSQEKTANEINDMPTQAMYDNAYPFFWHAGSLDPVPALDDIRLETDGSRTAMKLEEETASIAKHGTCLVATP